MSYKLQRVLDTVSINNLKVSTSPNGTLLDKILEYLPIIPLCIISLITLGYVFAKLRPKWTKPFIEEEPVPEPVDSSTKVTRPSLVWSICLAIFAILAIAISIVQLLKQKEFRFTAILRLVSWTQVVLVLALSNPRYCPSWLLAFYFVYISIDLSTVPNWTDFLEFQVIVQYANIIISLLSFVVVAIMPFQPVSPASGPIGVAGLAPSIEERSPEDSLRLWQFLTTSWVWPLLMVGKSRQMQKEDVWKLGYGFQSARVISAFHDVRKSTMFIRLLIANKGDCAILVLAAFVTLFCELSGPVLFQQLLATMENPHAPKAMALMFALMILARGLLAAQIASLTAWFSRRCYERTRAALIMTVYEKVLNRKVIIGMDKPKTVVNEAENSTAENGNGSAAIVNQSNGSNGHANGSLPKKDTKPKGIPTKWQLFKELFWPTKETKVEPTSHASTGQILNLVRTDADQIAKRFVDIERIVITPIGTVISIYLVWRLLGWSCFLALAVIFVTQGLNAIVARLAVHWQRLRKKATDERVQINSQFIEVIRHLRWYGWEQTWLEKVMTARQHELHIRLMSVILGLSSYILTVCASSFLPVVAFFSYTAFAGQKLRIDLIFPTLQLIRYLRAWLRDIPTIITTLLEAYVAMERIENFLKEPDKEQLQSSGENNASTEQLTTLKLKDCNFAWPGTTESILNEVNLTIGSGLTMVYGSIGSGKTALLRALLGEMDMLSGQVDIPNEMIAYCSQTPWLQSISIRDNILFSAPYDELRYQKVLDCCQLLPDLETFKDGDMSHIGENGVGLSGGQRARVALARAIYSNARILLLDDPISALDSSTAENIVHKCLSGELVKSRIVVMVTHRTHLVHQIANQFVEVSSGHLNITSNDPFKGESKTSQPENSESKNNTAENQKPNVDNVAQQFIEEERREEGGIKAKVWLAFIQAGKYWWIFLLSMMILTQIASVIQSWFFKSWGEAYGESGMIEAISFHSTEKSLHVELTPFFANEMIRPIKITSWDPIEYLPSPNDDLKPWLILLFIVSLAQCVSLALYAVSQLTAVYATSKVIFENAMKRVTGAAFRFYDVNPVGRIMNRLTSDIQILDSALTYFGHTLFYFSLFISAIIVIAAVSPTFFLFSMVLMGMFILVFQQFLPASRSLKRLETSSLSPLYTIFGELLQDQGLTIVRAFHAQPSYYNRVIEAVDTYQGYGHFYNAVQNWLALRYELISTLSTFLLTAIALVTNLTPGLTAFVLMYASSFIAATHSLCMRFGDLQTEFISVERLVELLETDQEAEGTVHPPASWPQFGSDINFEHVTVRYAPHLDPSLKDITLHIPGGSTTAVIGRTGSGKSTLASAILNIVRAETGAITIDNIPLTNIHVQTLRHRVTFVPQDPVLFLGSIRQNLDPVDEFTDEECETVLKRLSAVWSDQSWTLDTHVESGGKNLSQGQRQLIGITRAVLRRSPIVILDEATASIDVATSIELQQILREELQEATIIIIAHRVEAVKGADYCVVLENGRVARQGKIDGEEVLVNENLGDQVE